MFLRVDLGSGVPRFREAGQLARLFSFLAQTLAVMSTSAAVVVSSWYQTGYAEGDDQPAKVLVGSRNPTDVAVAQSSPCQIVIVQPVSVQLSAVTVEENPLVRVSAYHFSVAGPAESVAAGVGVIGTAVRHVSCGGSQQKDG